TGRDLHPCLGIHFIPLFSALFRASDVAPEKPVSSRANCGPVLIEVRKLGRGVRPYSGLLLQAFACAA
ncbi:MAG: hypothetical protein AB7E24_08730, partial [Novosphingobium sp.]